MIVEMVELFGKLPGQWWISGMHEKSFFFTVDGKKINLVGADEEL